MSRFGLRNSIDNHYLRQHLSSWICVWKCFKPFCRTHLTNQILEFMSRDQSNQSDVSTKSRVTKKDRVLGFLPNVWSFGFNRFDNFVKMTTVKDWRYSCSVMKHPSVGAALSASWRVLTGAFGYWKARDQFPNPNQVLTQVHHDYAEIFPSPYN